MTNLFATTTRTREEVDAVVRNYRIIAIASGLTILCFGIIRSVTQPEGQDPLLERFLVACFCFSYAALTYFNSPVRRHPFMSIAVVACVIVCFTVHLAFLTGFSVNSAFSILLVTFVASLIMGTRASLILFESVAFGFAAAVILMVEQSEMSPIYFLATMACLCIFSYISLSHRIAVEDDLRLTKAEAVSAVESRTRFLANMSHEIRTPMNGVIGMTHLLEQSNLDETQRNYLKTIQVSGDVLLGIINDILDFAKVDAGEIVLDFHQFDLTELLENTVDLVQLSCFEKDLDLYLILEPGVPQFVNGDSNRLRQVVINLLNNAIKFTRQGSVTLSVRSEPTEDGPALLFSVADTGIGIAPEIVPTLFEAFSQADTSTTRKYGGTGLGLSISKHLVELMGGTISIESEPDKGSNFSFKIPVSQIIHQQLSQEQISAVSHLKSEGAKILIYVEDLRARLCIINFFDDMAIPVMVSVDRNDARMRFESGIYDLFFTDATFTKALSQNPGFIQVMGLTTDDQAEYSGRFITQPFKPSHLRRIALSKNPSMPETKTELSALSNLESIRVLLAEDNVINQKVATKMLEKYGFEIDVAGDGAEALQAIRDIDYDLILMDLQMPELSGIEVTEVVRSEGEECHIIALTANAFEEDRQACFTAGMNAYLSKPLRKEALETEIRRALRH